MSDRPEVYWVQDSGGVNTCHVNDGTLNFVQSLIGTLEQRGTNWHVILKDGNDIAPEDGFSSFAQAHRCLHTYYCGEKKPEVKSDRLTPRAAQRGKI
jgi:hypothetical protein